MIIRHAKTDDFKLVEQVFLDVWNQNILCEVYNNQVKSDQAVILVADILGDIAGAVSCFVHPATQGDWIIDLLAVKKRYQRIGIGTKLIFEASSAASKVDCQNICTLIRTDNKASCRAFEKAGFIKEGFPLQMVLWRSISSKANTISKSDWEKVIRFVRVETLTYRGVWIEELSGAQASVAQIIAALQTATVIVKNENRLNASTLIPECEMWRVPKHIMAQGKTHGTYCWWRKYIV